MKEKKLNATLIIRIEPDLIEKLKRLAERKERSTSGQIRAILKDYLEKVELWVKLKFL